MKYCILIVPLLVCNLCFSQTRLDTMISQLKQPDFIKIYLVKDSIANQQKNAIPKLIELLKDTSFVKLQNTSDLIYPGASTYYGHGEQVYYDIDWVDIRAAWLFEEITFQDFGYRLLDGKRSKIYHLTLADSVSKWWQSNKNIWTRYSALKEALSSRDELRQEVALQFLRFDETKCDGLTLENYKNEIRPLVRKIKHSKNTNAEQAKYLLQDHEYYWLKIKQKK